jgi:hypothetical protein
MKKLLLFIVLYEKTAPLCLEYALFVQPTYKVEKIINLNPRGAQRQFILRINLMSKK